MTSGPDLADLLVEARAGRLVAYFGYGSLVNRATHRTAIVAAFPARLSGWRRLWRPRPEMPFDPLRATPVALLSVTAAPERAIDGLLVFDRADNLAAIDLREACYDRRSVDPASLRLSGRGMQGEDASALRIAESVPIYVYEARADVPAHRGACPILQSYLDAVLQGFLVEHGEAGLRAFVSETDGFETPVLADRERPVYPRAVRLSEDERRMFDALLGERGVRFVTGEQASAG